jgi:flagellar biosynthesis/type III secretory pathway M-ring protein FliF/YscJ
MVILSLVGAYIVVSMIRKAQPEEEIMDMPEYDAVDEEDNLPALKEPEVDPQVRQVENRVKEIVDENPMKAASLIRHWLSSE